jgi:flagellar protein FliL
MAEEKAEAGAAAAEAAAEAPAKGGKGKLLAIVGVVVLLGGGAAAWFLGVIPHGTKHEAEAKEEVKQLEQPEVGALQALDPFIANLADEDGKRYLKATLQLEFFDAKVPDEFHSHLPLIRDLLLTLFTSKTFAEIRTPQGKTLLREEIVNRLNRAMRRDAVKAVYFTEFIVQ